MKSRKVYGIILMISIMTMFALSGCGGCECARGSCGGDTIYTCGKCAGCTSGCIDGGCGIFVAGQACVSCIDGYESCLEGYEEGYSAMAEFYLGEE